ncbi:MAG TPA: hypothetical protein VKV20_08285 [Ktedonobacteraceae bacterium]|jgi:hypothetical protein|nr:hypothetical protein [Ktedonobacteraceae bacterium]
MEDLNDLNPPDFTAPHFSVPDLSMTDLTMPDFSMPDVQRPDPLLPDLTMPLIPPDLDRPAVDEPDPASLDLAMPDIPGALDPIPRGLVLPDVNSHHAPGTYPPAMPPRPEVLMDERPGELAGSALTDLLDSPDMRQLPSDLTPETLYTHAQDMTSRLRRLGRLELGLENEERKQA